MSFIKEKTAKYIFENSMKHQIRAFKAKIAGTVVSDGTLSAPRCSIAFEF